MAWTGIGNWVFREPRVGEPVMSIPSLFIIVAMFGMAVFFFIAGMFTPRSLARKGCTSFWSIARSGSVCRCSFSLW
jgi:glucan biosynthesis protein C